MKTTTRRTKDGTVVRYLHLAHNEGTPRPMADGLGQDAAAWQRLSDSPISEHGPTAWLRLGEVLDAARAGSEWPIPPDR